MTKKTRKTKNNPVQLNVRKQKEYKYNLKRLSLDWQDYQGKLPSADSENVLTYKNEIENQLQRINREMNEVRQYIYRQWKGLTKIRQWENQIREILAYQYQISGKLEAVGVNKLFRVIQVNPELPNYEGEIEMYEATQEFDAWLANFFESIPFSKAKKIALLNCLITTAKSRYEPIINPECCIDYTDIRLIRRLSNIISELKETNSYKLMQTLKEKQTEAEMKSSNVS